MVSPMRPEQVSLSELLQRGLGEFNGGNFAAAEAAYRRVLPNAAITHCVRDPVDTCLSCFKTPFRESQLYSFDLTALGLYYRQYKRLNDQWKKLLPNRMLDICYEDVIEDLEGSARRLVAHCGLYWDDACLDFHSNKRPVHTASAGYVRRPIYTSSMGRWRRYETYPTPQLDALGPLVEP